MEDGDGPDAGDRTCTTSGPARLVRFDEAGLMQLQTEGLELLRGAKPPVRIVFAIGGSRCGKSTASNALAFGPAGCEAGGFETGDSFDPVTSGIDVATRVLPSGGTLVVADCEGAFHACASSRSARGFGTLGLLAYHMSSTLLHVSMGSIDERDIEAIGFLAAHGSSLAGTSEEEMPDAPQLPIPSGAAPGLVLLVNGARFNLGDDAARRLLSVPDDGVDSGRGSARAAIARGFRGAPAMEALPTCEHSTYWPKVNALRRRAAEAQPVLMPSGLQASGPDVVDQLVELAAVLNGEEPSVAMAREPEAATEAFYRSMHLEPLVEEISRRFAASGAASQPLGAKSAPLSGADAIEEALTEFDRRSAWLAGEPPGEPAGEPPAGELGAASDGGSSASPTSAAHVRAELIADVRTRLAARLAGISEALARGRQQEKARRARGQRPPPLSGSPTSLEKENVNPTPPSTPSKKSVALLENQMEEVEIQIEELADSAQQELSQLHADFGDMQMQMMRLSEEEADANRKAAMENKAALDRWQSSLRKMSEARLHTANTQATTSRGKLADLEGGILALGEQTPDVMRHASQLTEIRDMLEAQRLQRHEAGNAAQRAVEAQLRSLREEVSEQGQQLAALRDATSRQLAQCTEELRTSLQDESSVRIDRYKALREVVDRVVVSLEARVEARPSKTPPRSAQSLRTLEASKVARTTPRASSTLIGSSPCSSRSATPRRSTLPAPPAGHSAMAPL